MTKQYDPHRRRLLAGLAVVGLVPMSSAINVQAQTNLPKCQKNEPTGKRAKYSASLKKSGASHNYYSRVDIQPSKIKQKTLNFDPAITETELYLYIPKTVEPGIAANRKYNWRKLSTNLPLMYSGTKSAPLKTAYVHITMGSKTLMKKKIDYIVQADAIGQQAGDLKKKSHISHNDDYPQKNSASLRTWLKDNNARGNLKIRVSDREKGSDGLILTYKRKDILRAIEQADAALIDLEKQVDTGKCQLVPASSGCFMTTAACDVIGLADDCWELETLRNFRDGWLTEQKDGKADIAQYYVCAPNIISHIETKPGANRIWLKLYWQYILPSALMVKLGFNKSARKYYSAMMRKTTSMA